MQRDTPAIPRKLVEAAFRRSWLLLVPIVAVPTLVVMLVKHEVVYESTGTAWVTDVSGLGASSFTADADQFSVPPSERQVQILSDLLATRAFRDAIATHAGLVAETASAADRAAAADAIDGRLAAVASGPNLVTIKASAATPEEAQQLAASFIAHYQLRAQTETTREAATILAYFDQQVAEAEADVAATQAAIAAYLAAKPAVAASPDAEYQRLLSQVTLQQSVLSRVIESQKDAQLAAATITAGAQAIFVVQDMPDEPAAPLGVPLVTRAAYPAAGLFLGLVISAAWLWLAYRTDRTIRTAEDIEPGVAVLGVVPELVPADLARRFTPLRWAGFLRRDYARRVAASISPLPGHDREAS